MKLFLCCITGVLFVACEYPEYRMTVDVVDAEMFDAEPDAGCIDADSDGRCDVDDNCLNVRNPHQSDFDGDDIGDACDTDFDGDGIEDVSDNCSAMFNPDQVDLDQDGRGDICDSCSNMPDPEDDPHRCDALAEDNDGDCVCEGAARHGGPADCILNPACAVMDVGDCDDADPSVFLENENGECVGEE